MVSANASRSVVRNGRRPAAIVTNTTGSATSVHALAATAWPAVTEEKHPVRSPSLLDSHERELTPKPRMESVSHLNSSILTI